MRVSRNDVRTVLYDADVAQVNGGSGDRPDGRAQQDGKITAQGGVGSSDTLNLARPHVSGRHHQSGLADGGDSLFGRDLILAKLVGIEGDDDGALVSAERRRGGYARKGRKERADAIDGVVLQFALGVAGTTKDQFTNGDAAGVKARDEGRHGSRRHEGAGTVDVTDGLRHRLAHVGALVKRAS